MPDGSFGLERQILRNPRRRGGGAPGEPHGLQFYLVWVAGVGQAGMVDAGAKSVTTVTLLAAFAWAALAGQQSSCGWNCLWSLRGLAYRQPNGLLHLKHDPIQNRVDCG